MCLAKPPWQRRQGGRTPPQMGIVKLTQKIARLCSKEKTIEGFGLSRAPVFSLFPAPQLSSRGRRLRAIFINLTMPGQGLKEICRDQRLGVRSVHRRQAGRRGAAQNLFFLSRARQRSRLRLHTL